MLDLLHLSLSCFRSRTPMSFCALAGITSLSRWILHASSNPVMTYVVEVEMKVMTFDVQVAVVLVQPGFPCPRRALRKQPVANTAVKRRSRNELIW